MKAIIGLMLLGCGAYLVLNAATNGSAGYAAGDRLTVGLAGLALAIGGLAVLRSAVRYQTRLERTTSQAAKAMETLQEAYPGNPLEQPGEIGGVTFEQMSEAEKARQREQSALWRSEREAEVRMGEYLKYRHALNSVRARNHAQNQLPDGRGGEGKC